MFLIFDTETTGLPLRKDAPLTDFDNWPRLVQLAWQIHDKDGNMIEYQNHIVKPDGFIIPINAEMVHKISTEHALKVGKPLGEVLKLFVESASKAKYVVGHNIDFDLSVLGCEFLRVTDANPLTDFTVINTCTEKTAAVCKLPSTGGRFKLPKLNELYRHLFGEDFDSAHNAMADVAATARVFLELVRLGVIAGDEIKEGDDFFTSFKIANPDVIKPVNLNVESNVGSAEDEQGAIAQPEAYVPSFFAHLHVHSHYSILDGMSKVKDLVTKCCKTGMKAMALTDHGSMYGIKDFADCANAANKAANEEIAKLGKLLKNEKSSEDEKAAVKARIEELKKTLFKPIFGIETYCAPESIYKREGFKDRGWHLILLAKNKKGYKNLCKLSSIAFTEGFYYNARIDHSLLEKYKEGLIVCSACLAGEVPQKIMKGDIEGAEESILWFKKLFGDDYYLELQRHKTDKPGGDTEVYERQKEVNKVMIELAKKTGTRVIATNDVHFVEEEHAEAHDRLICLSTGKDYDDPTRMHYTKQEWLKTPEEMGAVFRDIPEALENTREIVDKVEMYSIDSEPLMPAFDIPADFGTEEEYRKKFTDEELFEEFTRDENGQEIMSREEAEKKIEKLGGIDKLYRIKLEADYLAKLTWEGARKRYGENITQEQRDRINFELHVMKTMGFPGYFLIVQDYIRGAREELGVSVGPGRGSAAGSVVAYCLKITDVDPLKYDLLFERFLNPDRISLPDIDVDFDADGRAKVLDWITKKYGKERVAHIITYGTMAAKSAIADVGRVQKIPLSEVNRIKSYVPDRSFEEAAVKAVDGKLPDKMPKVNLKNCYKYIPELKSILEGNDKALSTMLTYAEELEDTNRQTGIHACGVIIGSDDLTEFAPICTIKDKDTKEDVVVTQYDGHVIENVGLIKMDFLGLSTLTQIKDTLANIKKTRGIDVDIDNIPIDDPETYKLYCAGNTIGTFQFESPGMQKYLRDLKPTVFEDLIAMNALYRPGPLQYIPLFIDRKKGKKPITYDLPIMEKYLKETYGVTVYQEQVMLLSRELADFTRGESDTLRKAMGKKQLDKMMQLKDKFLRQGEAKGYDKNVLEHIWADWEHFAEYAFNKSHSTCYSWIAYQTAYLKAHYPSEFMASVLNDAKNDKKKLVSMMDECKRMKIPVQVPDVNESDFNFSVNSKGEIRYGLGGISGVGEAAVEAIVGEREAHGKYKDFTDFMLRVNLRSLNRKTLEAMAKAGAFDSFQDMHRAMFMYMPANENVTFLDKAIKMVNAYNERRNSQQFDLFGSSGSAEQVFSLSYPVCERWTTNQQLNFEFESLGLYLSAHPLDEYRIELENFTNVKAADIEDIVANKDMVKRELVFGGMVTNAEKRVGKNGNEYGVMKVQDNTGEYEFRLWKETYMKYKHLFEIGCFVLVKGFVRKPYKENETNMFAVTEMQILSDVLENTNRHINIKVNVRAMNAENVRNLIQIIKKHKGKQHYMVNLYDGSRVCRMIPTKGCINAKEVLYMLEELSFVDYEIEK